MKLFMFYLGGMVEGCLIELHDIQFAVGPDLASCYSSLKARWWGIPEKLHIDCWAEITGADGYTVKLVPAPSAEKTLRLFLVNVGGYPEGCGFTEAHENFLLVCPDETTAKIKALKMIEYWPGRHMDKTTAIDALIDVSHNLAQQGHYIQFIADPKHSENKIHHEYIPIGKDLF